MPKHCQINNIRRRLLAWFGANARDLPWRRTKDPYAIWVSEIMLQQTQVAAVVGYYNRFMRRFPTVQSLAKAREDTVLKLWEGLGYYSRGRNLHKAAKLIAGDYGGRLPDTVDELQKIPGIGRYTAGAIASIAFDRPAPILDGNVIRVLCRVYCIDADPKSPPAQKQLWDLAQQLVCTSHPGAFNEAMMELGAMVCTPRSPKCDACPLSKLCLANQAGRQNELPVKTAKAPLPHYTIVAGLVFKADKVLIDKRKSEGLLGGLWEFPGGKKETAETFKQAVVREVREETGVEVTVGKRLCIVGHTYSHFKITLHAYLCEYVAGTARAIDCTSVKWVTPEDLQKYAFPAANAAIIRALKTHLKH
jgi:A/G-specific adenine glycosylase